MKPILTFILNLMATFNPTDKTSVYICKGQGGKRYHNDRNCRGLKGSTFKIEKIPLKQAKAEGKTLCGWE